MIAVPRLAHVPVLAATLLAASIATLWPGPSAQAQTPTLEELDQQVRILARKLEIEREAVEAAAKKAPQVKADASGLSISSPDFGFQFRGLLQGDGRWWTGDSVPHTADTFTLRRVRPTFQGTVGDLVGFRFTPEFAGSNATIVDAWIDLNLASSATLRIGKQKGPVGLERLQSGSAIHFIERGLPTELAPNREIGLQLQGTLLDKTLSYTVGVYNGTNDGTTDNDGRKDVALRLFYEPIAGIGFGVAGSHGSRDGNAPRNYSTVDRRSGVSFLNGTVYDGDATRISPQGYFYRGPFGLLAEYISSEQVLANGTTRDELTHSAWQVVGSYVLTGEDASYRGVHPKTPFHAGKDGWGALELVARYGELKLDADAADLSFVAADGVESIENLGVGLNWHLTRNVKAAVNYNHTTFGNYSGPDRDSEKSIFTRLQLSF